MFKFFCCQFGCLDNHFRSYSHCFEIAGYLETTGSYTFFSPFFSALGAAFAAGLGSAFCATRMLEPR